MRTEVIILVFVIIVGPANTQSDFCSCSQFSIENECLFHDGLCSWDTIAQSCSELACDERSSNPLLCFAPIIQEKSKCVINENKCQNIKATCVEYEINADSSIPFCNSAIEGHCQVDTVNNKCKKLDRPITCSSYKTYDDCKYGVSLESSSASGKSCYFDFSKEGTDDDPNCLDLPIDCSGQTEASCNALTYQCFWENEKCQALTCNDLPESHCILYFKDSETLGFCDINGSTCQEVDPKKFKESECHISSFFTYHFDGSSCQPCQGLGSFFNYSVTSFMGLILILMS